MTTSKVSLRFNYTETGSALVFDKVLVDDTVPDGTPPAAYDSGSNKTAVTGSLSQ